MRIALVTIALLGCGEKTPDVGDSGTTTTPTTTTTTNVSTTTTGSTSTTTTTASVGRSGTYVGTMHIDVVDIGIVQNPDNCDADMTLVIDEQGVPQITSITPCTMVGPFVGEILEVTLSGDITADPDVGGNATMVWLEQAPFDLWAGQFTGPDTLEGRFEGESPRASWDVTFSVTR